MAATPRVISAGHTRLIKFGVPALFVFSAIVVAVDFVQQFRPHDEVPPFAVAAAAFAALVLTWVVHWTANLKQVALADAALHISNFRREIVVPLRDVERVRQSLFENTLVIIDLARDSDFGRRIRFVPKRARRWASAQQQPIVDHLRDAVAAAKQAERPTPDR